MILGPAKAAGKTLETARATGDKALAAVASRQLDDIVEQTAKAGWPKAQQDAFKSLIRNAKAGDDFIDDVVAGLGNFSKKELMKIGKDPQLGKKIDSLRVVLRDSHKFPGFSDAAVGQRLAKLALTDRKTEALVRAYASSGSSATRTILGRKIGDKVLSEVPDGLTTVADMTRGLGVQALDGTVSGVERYVGGLRDIMGEGGQ
jgi:hypothetical protein